MKLNDYFSIEKKDNVYTLYYLDRAFQNLNITDYGKTYVIHNNIKYYIGNIPYIRDVYFKCINLYGEELEYNQNMSFYKSSGTFHIFPIHDRLYICNMDTLVCVDTKMDINTRDSKLFKTLLDNIHIEYVLDNRTVLYNLYKNEIVRICDMRRNDRFLTLDVIFSYNAISNHYEFYNLDYQLLFSMESSEIVYTGNVHNYCIFRYNNKKISILDLGNMKMYNTLVNIMQHTLYKMNYYNKLLISNNVTYNKYHLRKNLYKIEKC